MITKPLRIRAISIFVLCFVVALPIVTNAETLQELLQRQADLRNQQQQKEQQLQASQSQSDSLTTQISQIGRSIDSTTRRISDTEEQISVTLEITKKLSEDATSEQGKLEDFQSRLRSAYIALYELSRSSSSEQLAQGDSVSDVVSREMYIQSIQDQLTTDIAGSKQLLSDLKQKKTESEKQQANLAKLKDSLASDQVHLARQRRQNELYLAATQRDQAKIKDDLEKLKGQQEVLSSQIYEARRAMGVGETTTGGTGGYAYAYQCGGVDPWLFYMCQCTSYAAWNFLYNNGLVFFNTRPGQGSAWNWPALARDQGYTVSSTPRAGDIVSWPRFAGTMPYGHVAIVTAVHDGLIDVDEYNWTEREQFDHRTNVDPQRYGTPSYIRP